MGDTEQYFFDHRGLCISVFLNILPLTAREQLLGARVALSIDFIFPQSISE